MKDEQINRMIRSGKGLPKLADSKASMSEDDKDLIAIKLTKEQWEEVYQWYLCIKDEYRVEDFEKDAAKTICESVYGEGSFI